SPLGTGNVAFFLPHSRSPIATNGFPSRSQKTYAIVLPSGAMANGSNAAFALLRPTTNASATCTIHFHRGTSGIVVLPNVFEFKTPRRPRRRRPRSDDFNFQT